MGVSMVQYVLLKVSEESVMITRREPLDPPIDGLPPYLTSSLTCKKSELPHIINVLSAYVIETQ
mgnify:CR=1 FL=1